MLVRFDPPQAGNPVGLAAALELIEPGKLTLVGGDDQLAVLARLDSPLAAIGVEQAGPLDTEPRLERSRRVVDARVDHPAGMGGLVGRQPVLALQHAEAGFGVPGEKLARHRESQYAAADDDEVAACRRLGHRRPRLGQH